MSTRPDRIDVETAHEYLSEGRATMIDARPVEKWEAAEDTIRDSVHVSPGTGSEVDRVLGRLPRERLFIVFCDEPGNAASAAVARRIRELGLGDASVLEGGLRAWKEAALPVGERPVDPRALPQLDDNQLEALCVLSFWFGLAGGDRARGWTDTRDSMLRYVSAVPQRLFDDFRRFVRAEHRSATPDGHGDRVVAIAPILGERAVTLFGEELRGKMPGPPPSPAEILAEVLSEGDSALLYAWLRTHGRIAGRPGIGGQGNHPNP
jgi:rhodanese-related sulfurtransferase